ncbi:MAG: hypothetical protein ACRYFU_11995 [Janthinobacterium lividum]
MPDRQGCLPFSGDRRQMPRRAEWLNGLLCPHNAPIRERSFGPTMLKHSSTWQRKGLTAEGRLQMCKLVEQARGLTPKTPEETAEMLNKLGYTTPRGQKWTKRQVLRFQAYQRHCVDHPSSD